MRARLGFWVAACLVGLSVSARAGQDAPTPPANDDCLACHGDASVTRADHTSVAVDATVFEASMHGPMACVDCHQDLATVTDFPHPDTLAKVDCGTCHEDTVKAYAEGVHARARQGGGLLAATCTDCHGTHDIKPSSDPTSRTYHLNLPGTCERCHGNADIIKRGNIRIGDVAVMYDDSIHGKALEKSGLVVAPSCVDCHGSHDIERRTEPTSSVARANVPATCGKCHEGIEHLYDTGVHAAALKAGNAKAPVCSDCHTAHAIQRVDTSDWRLSVAAECGTCHSDVVESFRRTFHGKVTQLGFTRVAACADCHGAHDILPASNPASTVSSARLVETCRKCHAGANARFVEYDPHPNPRDYERGKVLWYANRLYWILIPACFGFFGLHSVLWFWRSRRDGRGKGEKERRLIAAGPGT